MTFELFSEESVSGVVAGVDEVGRGPLAGDVVAAAVILDGALPAIEGLGDSKALLGSSLATSFLSRRKMYGCTCARSADRRCSSRCCSIGMR